jgi:sugar phosphate isomerase/epimerase
MDNYHFKLGMFLPELDLPFEQALATARELGAEYVWFSRARDMPPIAEWSDRDADRVGRLVAQHNLKWLVVSADNPFKEVHLTDLPLDGIEEHPLFRRDFALLLRSMQLAQRLGVGAVFTHAFAWPGEYSAGKPTWPMRWLTRGGVIADVDLEKLTRAFSRVADEAERHELDVVVGMLPWHYTNTTTNVQDPPGLAGEQVGPRLGAVPGLAGSG